MVHDGKGLSAIRGWGMCYMLRSQVMMMTYCEVQVKFCLVSQSVHFQMMSS